MLVFFARKGHINHQVGRLIAEEDEHAVLSHSNRTNAAETGGTEQGEQRNEDAAHGRIKIRNKTQHRRHQFLPSPDPVGLPTSSSRRGANSAALRGVCSLPVWVATQMAW